ncbi:hypothetical protein B0O99DRAFT_596883 [Bisporella sp. PMI_857]|nr:hypothetical protein B0O99DRAFT_596883 [Bisporella sp. PMI_857]
MSLRSFPFSSGSPSAQLRRQWQRVHIHTTARRGSQNHYEVLQITPGATPAEVKKSFYALSKKHHPDHNPDDPHASQRFVKISEAYGVLGTPAKRREYDRDHMQARHTHRSHPRAGSYSSTSPAGGRPASGLSRRRTQFRGPPPSFYRNGAWGDHSEKRSTAQNDSAPGTEKPGFGENFGGGMGGMGPGQRPWGHWSDVPHFDKEGHRRTHEGIESERRRHRIRAEWDRRTGDSLGGTTAWQMLVFTSIVAFAAWLPTVVLDKMTRPKKREAV